MFLNYKVFDFDGGTWEQIATFNEFEILSLRFFLRFFSFEERREMNFDLIMERKKY